MLHLILDSGVISVASFSDYTVLVFPLLQLTPSLELRDKFQLSCTFGDTKAERKFVCFSWPQVGGILYGLDKTLNRHRRLGLLQ